MKIPFIGAIILIGLAAIPAAKGQEAYLTIDDCYNPKYYPTSMKGVQWIPGSHKFSQVKGDALVATDPYSKKDDTIFTLSRLNAALSVDNVTLKAIPAVTWKDNNSLWFLGGNRMFIYTVATQTTILKRRMPEKPEALEISPESLNVAAVEGDNI